MVTAGLYGRSPKTWRRPSQGNAQTTAAGNLVRRLGVPDLSTIVLTMTLTALASQSPLAGWSGGGTVRRSTAVLAMFAGALAGAAILKASLAIPLWLAAALGLLTLLAHVPAATGLGRAAKL